MGTWVIYSFGDVSIFWNALNAVAAFFNNSGFIMSAALLGGLVGLTQVLFGFATQSATMGQAMRMTGIWGALVFFTAFLPVTVQVQNVYTGQSTVVANVPAVVAIPASVFTTAGWSITQTMDTAFQSTAGSYLTVSQNGLLNPLEIYMSLFNDSYFAKQNPILMQNLFQTISSCSAGSTITRGVTGGANSVLGTTATLDTTIDIATYLQNNLRQTGFVTWINPNSPSKPSAPLTISCGQAATNLTAALGEVFTSCTSIGNMIAAGTGSATSVTGGAYTCNDFFTAFGSYANATNNLQQTGTQHGQALIIGRAVNYAYNCIQQSMQSSSVSSAKSCMEAGMYSANTLLQSQNEMVQNGSAWMKMLYNSMIIMQYLFFALAPVTLIVMLIWPTHSPKMFGGYMMFGLWISSWLIFSAPLNYYIQTDIIKSIDSILHGNGVTIANIDIFRETMMQKLAFAASLVASTPIIALGILSGSYLSLNSLASGLAAEGHAKGDDISPRMLSRAASDQAAPGQQTNTNTGLSIETGSKALSIDRITSTSSGVSSSRGVSESTVRVNQDTVTIASAGGKTSTHSLGDVSNYTYAINHASEKVRSATGFIASDLLANSNGINQIAKEVAGSNKNLSPQQAREVVQASIRNEVADNLGGDWAARAAGTVGGTQAERDNNATRANEQFRQAMHSKLSKLDSDDNARKMAAATVGSYAAGLTPGSDAYKSIVGSLSQTAKDGIATSIGSGRGISVTDSVAISRTDTNMRSKGDSFSTSYGKDMTYTVTGGTSAVTTRRDAADLNTIAGDYEAHPELARIDAAKALAEPAHKIAEVKRMYGIHHSDPVIENALAYTALTGSVDFTRIERAGLTPNANEAIGGVVNARQNQPLARGGPNNLKNIDLSESQRKHISDAKEKSATFFTDVYELPQDTPEMARIDPRNSLEPPGP